MDKWIPPTIVILFVLVLFVPWILLIIGIILGLWILFYVFYFFKTPTPYISTDGASITINWFTRGFKKTSITIAGSINYTYFPSQVIQNRYTDKWVIYSEKITDLDVGNKFNYKIYVEKENGRRKMLFGGKDYWFIMPSKNIPQTKNNKSLVIAAYGDVQPRKTIPPLIQYRIVNTMNGIEPMAWRWFFHIHGKLLRNTPIIGIPGNHDYKTDKFNPTIKAEEAYQTYMNYPDDKKLYDIHFYGVHILALNYYTSYSKESANYKYIKSQLENNINDKEWLICIWHTSPYNSVKKGQEELEVRENIVPLVTSKGCKLWLAGHEHAYQRYDVDGVHYLTTGATSSFHRHWIEMDNMVKIVMKMHFVIMDITTDRILVKAISLNDSVIDEFSIMKK